MRSKYVVTLIYPYLTFFPESCSSLQVEVDRRNSQVHHPREDSQLRSDQIVVIERSFKRLLLSSQGHTLVGGFIETKSFGTPRRLFDTGHTGRSSRSWWSRSRSRGYENSASPQRPARPASLYFLEVLEGFEPSNASKA